MFFINYCFVAAICAVASAHTVITYPGWRGDNLILNDTFPYGMQWSYPCGGMPTSTNRTNWPVTGGAIAVQPGWLTGHKTALIYINLGLGTDGPGGGPPNMSFPMVPPFEIVGPSNNPYPGTFCLPQVPLPANVTVNVGAEATIQVVETTVHGAALYNCVDITFALAADVAELNDTNCFNSTTISFNNPFVATSTTNSSETASVTDAWGVATCTACSACPTATPSSCPKTNGNVGSNEGPGVGVQLGALALGILAL